MQSTRNQQAIFADEVPSVKSALQAQISRTACELKFPAREVRRPSRFAGALRSIAAVLGACTIIGGCGGDPQKPDLVSVSGQVTLDGDPLTTGVVLLQPLDPTVVSHTANGLIDNEGRFNLGTFERGDGVAPGEFAVAIMSYEIDPETGAEGDLLIPRRYTFADQSGLSAEIPHDSVGTELAFHLNSDSVDSGSTAP
ncbi:hypothetical protein [Stratiformator vulcanicus]|uniref:Carboxypeptidase regulatory-like domain-containing protein n=1 Tax=Stratiformator vulcanicus TaxID=2527980 RepID=A0A517R4E2_9PLAN|nr:hypothetical protein [Stratiformator vulcanicus]QDT38720.1 hypothetical protein Pan189_31170 [Stratiformator vulcanicus]